MKTPILGSSYVANSVHAANSRMVNLFPEIVPEGGKESAFLTRAPGLKLLLAVGDGPIRGMIEVNSVLYVVSRNKLYSVDLNYVVTQRGIVTESTDLVNMASNGIQIFIACNGPSFIYNTQTTAFGQITDGDFEGAVSVTYLDGYFVFVPPTSQKLWVTALLDGTSIDPLDFASAESSPDHTTAVIADHREIWVFGKDSMEVWYNSGDLDFPLSRIQGAVNEIGCDAANSIAKMDNGLFWLGRDARGNGIVYRSNGYRGNRISTHALEWQIQEYDTISDAIGYTYQQDGHNFYVLTFPSANTTWVYDSTTGAWHERAGFINGMFTRHRGNCQAFFNNLTIVGDFQIGNLYTFDKSEYSDNGASQKWLRSWRAIPAGQNNLKRTLHHSLQLDIETGVGLSNGQGSDPQVMLRWSDDGGHTWSNEHWRGMGKIGVRQRGPIWHRLGMTMKLRDRVYEVSGTDPVKITITGAEIIMSGTNA